jgi:ppGpp synthetase/RelA/SpoT-type nucleotidyltranferase
LVDKLRRPPSLPLGSFHDVAGARIVIDGGRWEQDQAGDRIMAAFADCPKPPQQIDRRERPSHGYRALHVIVFEDATPVEIQIRTQLQDAWAQITEKLGDMWGRGLRYGEPPTDPDARQLVAWLGSLSERIDRHERYELKLQQLAARRGSGKQQLPFRLDTRVAKAKEEGAICDG